MIGIVLVAGMVMGLFVMAIGGFIYALYSITRKEKD